MPQLPEESPQQPPPPPPSAWDEGKLSKDEANRSRQSLSCSESGALDVSAGGGSESSWKRKKGPAPGRPTALRRKVSLLLSLRKKLF